MAKSKPASAGSAKFDPAKLTKEQQEAVVEHVLGLHPKYFVFAGLEITPDMYRLAKDGKSFTAWKGQVVA